MTEQEINNLLLLLECTLINEENPDYIEVSEQNGVIYVLLSKADYKYYKMHERIQRVYGLIEFEHSDILEQMNVIIECLTSEELDNLFKMYGYDEDK